LFDLIVHAEYGNRVCTINGSGDDGGATPGSASVG
jgi:hypothetical protein